jgi:aquaporin Z
MATFTAKMLGAEFLGTYILMLTFGCSVLSDSGMLSVLSIATALMVMTYALVSISGAVFNPAVTFGMYVAGQEPDIVKVILYISAQLCGGICAGMTYVLIFHDSILIALSPGIKPESMADFDPRAGGGRAVETFDLSSVGLVETIYTYVISLVVIRAAVKARQIQTENESFGMAIGGAVVAGGYAGKWITGSCFNPAVSFGMDLSTRMVGKGEISGRCFIYAAMELVGGLWAGLTHIFLDSKVNVVYKKCVSEFLGTFVLVFTVVLSDMKEQNEAAALSIGASLMVMIYALGPVSGGHFNPAVSTSLVLSGKLDLFLYIPYVAAQLAGGFAAWGSVGGVMQMRPYPAAALGPGDFEWRAVGFAEGVFTCVLCFVMLNVTMLAAPLDGKRFYRIGGENSLQVCGVAVGACLVLGRSAVGKVSGGMLNPALAIPLGAGAHFSQAQRSLVYCGFEVGGAILAALLFAALRRRGGQLQLEDAKNMNYGTV